MQRVRRLMQQHGIRARGKQRFRVTATDSGHNLPIAPNLLNRNFTPAAPNQTWAGDIAAPSTLGTTSTKCSKTQIGPKFVNCTDQYRYLLPTR